MRRLHSLALNLALAGLLVGPASAARLAVVLAKPLPALLAAAAGVAAHEGVRAEQFDLSKGTREVDRLVAAFQAKRFDGAVAFGAPAYSLLAGQSHGVPFAGAFLSGTEAGTNAVEEDPTSAEWVAVIAALFPRGATVATIDSQGVKAAFLTDLGRRLAAHGLKLRVERAGANEGVSTIAARTMHGAQAFFYPRTRELLNRTAAISVLKSAGRAKVPVLAFSASLIKAGALLSLELSPNQIGLRAAAIALGEAAAPSTPKLRVNLDRARSLGITIPRHLQQHADH